MGTRTEFRVPMAQAVANVVGELAMNTTLQSPVAASTKTSWLLRVAAHQKCKSPLHFAFATGPPQLWSQRSRSASSEAEENNHYPSTGV